MKIHEGRERSAASGGESRNPQYFKAVSEEMSEDKWKLSLEFGGGRWSLVQFDRNFSRPKIFRGSSTFRLCRSEAERRPEAVHVALGGIYHRFRLFVGAENPVPLSNFGRPGGR